MTPAEIRLLAVAYDGDQFRCAECSGENSRLSYRKRSTNLSACLREAALEEMRVRAAVDRVCGVWGTP